MNAVLKSITQRFAAGSNTMNPRSKNVHAGIGNVHPFHVAGEWMKRMSRSRVAGLIFIAPLKRKETRLTFTSHRLAMPKLLNVSRGKP